jgi:hypothetical protein
MLLNYKGFTSKYALTLALSLLLFLVPINVQSCSGFEYYDGTNCI